MNLGHRIRQRRKQLKMSQQALAQNTWTRGYIRQVDLGKISPSIETLSEIARRLDITLGELFGDDAILRAAKTTLLTPTVCQEYLKQLPDTVTKQVLCHLAESLIKGTTPTCQLPPNTELYYLTAQVMMHQEKYQQAAGVLETALRFSHTFWRMRILKELIICYQTLDDSEGLAKVQTLLRELCSSLKTPEDMIQLVKDSLGDGEFEHLSAGLLEIVVGLEWSRDLCWALRAVEEVSEENGQS